MRQNAHFLIIRQATLMEKAYDVGKVSVVADLAVKAA